LGWLSLLLALVACAPPPPASRDPLRVVTTAVPITLFTLAVAGECAEVTPLIPPNLGAHDVQARPAAVAALGQARVLVTNGLGLEGYLGRLMASAENQRLTVIDTSRGVSPLPSADGSSVNPHIWLDPLRAVQQVETIRDGLVRADPRCREGYHRRAATFSSELRRLNREIAAQLRPYAGRTFVAQHDFAPYFAERYNLRRVFLVDGPDLQPSPADLQRVATVVRAERLQALLAEPEEGHRSFQVLAADLGVRVLTFDPLETSGEEASRDPATYGRVMRRNVANLVQALGG